MKKIIIISLLFFSSCVMLQPADPVSAAKEKVFDFPGSNQNYLHEKSKQWLATNFRSSKSIIEYDNKQEGKIIGNIILIYNITSGLRMKLTIDIQNNKTKLYCVPLGMVGNTGMEMSFREGMREVAEDWYPILFNDYETFMNTKKTASW